MTRAIAAGIAALLAFTAPAAAQDIKGPVRILVGYPPGGSADILSRLLADRMKDALNTTVVVENKAGAGGRVAADQFKNAAPDGSVLMVTNIAVAVIAPLTYTSLKYDPAVDFAPVIKLGDFQLALATGPATGAKTFAEYATFLKGNPGKATYGIPATGSLPHFFGVMLGRALDVTYTAVPYRGGSPLNTDLVAGQVPAGIDALVDFTELHKAGKIAVLGTSGVARAPQTPDVPTFTELGFKDIAGTGWFGVFAPAKTPEAIIARYNQVIAGMLRQPEVVQRLTALAIEPAGGSPADLARQMTDDRAKWGPVIKASGYKPEE